ncbi:MAG: hypothetical protein C5B49_04285 [Bdellovibrio sp.]|nr:MAG: hypothetical protein C5B49_04285 [Bdellovibrio sp.]
MASQDKAEHQKIESEMKAIFAAVKATSITAPPFLQSRILAHWREGQTLRRRLVFWRALSFASLGALVVMGSLHVLRPAETSPTASVNQYYVIHVDFSEKDQQTVSQAEVELPPGVHFASSKTEVRNLHSLRLPVRVAAVGRGKLPFVVSSDHEGRESILVRLIGPSNEVIREQTITVQFAKSGSVDDKAGRGEIL